MFLAKWSGMGFRPAWVYLVGSSIAGLHHENLTQKTWKKKLWFTFPFLFPLPFPSRPLYINVCVSVSVSVCLCLSVWSVSVCLCVYAQRSSSGVLMYSCPFYFLELVSYWTWMWVGCQQATAILLSLLNTRVLTSTFYVESGDYNLGSYIYTANAFSCWAIPSACLH